MFEDSIPVVYVTPTPVYFSALVEQPLGLTLQWKSWKLRFLELRNDATILIRRTSSQRSASTLSPIIAKYNLSEVTITHIGNSSKITHNELIQSETGVLLEVKALDGHSTQIRIILCDSIRNSFYEALRKVSKVHNLDNIRENTITNDIMASFHGNFADNQSIMRSAIAFGMDQFDNRSKVERIIARRGVMSYLPVFFSNDLVHGSLWFIIGSIAFVISSAVILANSFTHDIGDDDSILSRFQYRSSWVLMLISGIFCTLGNSPSFIILKKIYIFFVSGSIAFMRAVHEDPPMKPLFSWYHVQSDELLGSWLFFLAAVPIIPYSLIYIAASHEDLVYLGAFAVSLLLVVGTFLFVRACYPTEKGKVGAISNNINFHSNIISFIATKQYYSTDCPFFMLLLLLQRVAEEAFSQ